VRILHLLFFLKAPCCSIVFLELMLRGEGHLANLAIVAFFFKDRCVSTSVSFVDSLWTPTSDFGQFLSVPLEILFVIGLHLFEVPVDLYAA
jgi:hypothetical protein